MNSSLLDPHGNALPVRRRPLIYRSGVDNDATVLTELTDEKHYHYDEPQYLIRQFDDEICSTVRPVMSTMFGLMRHRDSWDSWDTSTRDSVVTNKESSRMRLP